MSAIPDKVILDVLSNLSGLVCTALEQNAEIYRLLGKYLPDLPSNERAELLASMTRQQTNLPRVKAALENALKPYRS